MRKYTVRRKLKMTVVLALLLAVVLQFVKVNAYVDTTSYDNTRYLVEWEAYTFSNIEEISSNITKDFVAFKSLDSWTGIDFNRRLDIEQQYKKAMDMVKIYRTICKKNAGKYYKGFTASNLKNLKSSLNNAVALYGMMEQELMFTDSNYYGFYNYQTQMLMKALKALSGESIKSIVSVAESYAGKIPKSYFKISYKTVNISEGKEVEAYNSLYTTLVSGKVALTYERINDIQYNNTVVSLGKGKGCIVYPLGVVGRVKYVKVTYVCK